MRVASPLNPHAAAFTPILDNTLDGYTFYWLEQPKICWIKCSALIVEINKILDGIGEGVTDVRTLNTELIFNVETYIELLTVLQFTDKADQHYRAAKYVFVAVLQHKILLKMLAQMDTKYLVTNPCALVIECLYCVLYGLDPQLI